MRRITMWVLATVCGLVLLFSYRTSTNGSESASAGTAEERPATTSDQATSDQASGAASPSASGSSGSGSTSGTTRTVKGNVVQTEWGAVQVQVKITGTKLVDVTALQYPNDNHKDVEINNRALPRLRTAALAAQSADIDTVSGATVTSNGYRESLQSALDAANFKG